MNKKILIASLVTLASVAGVVGTIGNAHKVDAATPSVLYLKPEAWTSDGARFAAYFFGNGDKWVSMTDTDGDDVYEVDAPTGYPSVIFCRMNPNTAENNWDNKWNQSADLSIPTNGDNCWKFGGNWDTGAGSWSTYTPAVAETPEQIAAKGVNTLVEKYYNKSVYVKDTTIYLDPTAAQELQIALDGLFHDGADDLIRTTYFNGNELWMTNEFGVNSGYGTIGENMTHFSYVNGEQNIDYNVPKGKGTWTNPEEAGMEGYYITLKDIVATEGQKWSVTDNVYSSSDETLIEYFKAITAPCYKGFNEKVSNYIGFSHVEIEELTDTLELRLYVSNDDKEKVTTEDKLFSKAVITKGGYKIQIDETIYDLSINEGSTSAQVEYKLLGVSVTAGQEVKVLKYGQEVVTVANYKGNTADGKVTKDYDSCDLYVKWNNGSIDEIYASEPPVEIDVNTIYFTNNKGWSKVNCYYWGGASNAAWPGDAMTFSHKNGDEQDVYVIKLPEGTQNIIFNNGTDQTIDIKISDLPDGHNAYYISGGSGKQLTVGTWSYQG